VRSLEQRLVDVNARNVWDKTALYIACQNGHTSVAQYLMDNGAHVCCERTHPLIAAVRYNHYDCVKLLLDYHADVNCTNLRKETPMSIALQMHPVNMKLMLLLLQHGAIPSKSLGVDISVQLLKNAEEEHAKTIQKLIDRNVINLKRVDVNALTEGQTPLYLACESGN